MEGENKIRMFVRHQVNDFATWEKEYNDFKSEGLKMGVLGESVCQGVEDPNDVTVTHDFNTMEEAQAFLSSESLKSAMQASGVEGEPTIWFTKMGS